MKTLILSILGKDRPGIIAAVTGELYKAGCNLEDISMTILEGEFAMMLVLTPKRAPASRIQAGIGRLAKKMGLTVTWKIYSKALRRGEKHLPRSESYVIRVSGHDRGGIVHHVSRLLAARKVNISGLTSRILGYGKQALYLMILEADLPAGVPVPRLEAALQKLAGKLQLEISFRPLENIQA
ncbi:MAG: glycine cleavage system protein R [Candidatus Omnitrophota bacterium]